jgi:hypothetical protein
MPIRAYLHQPRSQLVWIDHGSRRQHSRTAREVGVNRILRPVRHQDEARGDSVHRRPRSGPVAHLDGLIALDLVHVEDVVPVRQPEAGILAERTDELDEHRARKRRQPSLGRNRSRKGFDRGTDLPAPAVEALHRTQLLQRSQQPGNSALRKIEAIGERGDPRRARCHGLENRKCSLDRLHHCGTARLGYNVS